MGLVAALPVLFLATPAAVENAAAVGAALRRFVPALDAVAALAHLQARIRYYYYYFFIIDRFELSSHYISY